MYDEFAMIKCHSVVQQYKYTTSWLKFITLNLAKPYQPLEPLKIQDYKLQASTFIKIHMQSAEHDF